MYLLVGKNNCGKTSILEAIELLVSEGNSGILYKSLQRRGGMNTRRRRGDLMNISHLFHGHHCTLDTSFELLSNDGKGTVKARIVSLEKDDEISHQWERRWRQTGLFDSSEDATPIPVLGMAIGRGDPDEDAVLPLMDDGTILTGYRHRYILMKNRYSGAPIHFLTLDDFDPASMGGIWNTILKNGIESQIISEMKLLEPTINSIHFLTNIEPGSDILIGHNDGRRLPISTYGDGDKKASRAAALLKRSRRWCPVGR